MRQIYWDIEIQCRNHTRRLCYYILLHMQVFVVAFFYAMYNIYRGKLDTSTWPLPFNFAVPFDVSTIWGWLLMWFIQTNCAFSYCLTMISLTTYFMSSCYYIWAVCDHLEFKLRELNALVELSMMEVDPIKHLIKIRRIKEEIIEIIKLHAKIFE